MLKNKKTKTVLVTGASGMLGFETAHYFAGKGYKVIGLHHKNPDLSDKRIENFSCDLGDPKSVGKLMKKIPKLDLIVHAASMTGVDKCEKNKQECFASNVSGAIRMVDLARRNNSPLIYISTGSVFSGERGDYKEEDPVEPKNYYSLTKAMGETAVLSYENGIVVRATPIGLHPKPRPQSNFLEWIVDSIKQNRKMNLFTDVYLNAISAKTLARLLYELPRKMKRGLIHMGSRDKLSKADIGLMVARFFKDYSPDITLASIDDQPSNNFAARPKEMWLNVKRATSLGLKMPNLKKEVESVFST